MNKKAEPPSGDNAQSEMRWKLWKGGCAPADALARYGSPELVHQFEMAMARISDLDKSADLILSWNDHFPGERVPANPELHAYAHKRQVNQRKLQARLEKEILERLERGSLIALGFQVPRSTSDAPTEVLHDVLSCQMGWSSTDTIGGNGLEYVAVRINKTPLNHHEITNAKGPGRWTRRDQIRKALDELLWRGEISLLGKRAPQWPLIKKMVLKLYPNNEHGEGGLGDDVLDQELVRLIDWACETGPESEKL